MSASREVFVRGLPELPSLQDFVVQYFQSYPESCGGTVSYVRLLGPGQAVVTFQDESVAQNVMAQPQHIFHGSKLKVGPWLLHLTDDEKDEENDGVVIRDDPVGKVSSDVWPNTKCSDVQPTADHKTCPSTYPGSDQFPSPKQTTTKHRRGSASPTRTTVTKVPIVEGCVTLLLQYHRDVLRDAEDLFSVRVEADKTGFSVSGTDEGTSEAKTFLEDVAASVKTDILQTFKPGIYHYLKEEQGREVLQTVEQDFQCVILLETVSGATSSRTEVDLNAEPTGKTTPTMYSCTSQPGQTELHIRDVTVQVQLGDITQEAVGAIVNPSQNTLDLNKGVSRAISAAAGPRVQEECHRYIKENRSPKAGEIVVTEAGDLPCGVIFHLVQPTAKYLKVDVKNCLLMAHQMNLLSITFPALGTGGFHIKPERSAKCLIDGIVEFVEDCRPTTLSLVRIVVFQEHMLQAFHTAVHRKTSQEDIRKLASPKNVNRFDRLKNIATDKVKRVGKRPTKERTSPYTTQVYRPVPSSETVCTEVSQPPDEEEVLLHIFSLDQANLENARQTVEGFIQQYATVVVIDDDKELGISQLVKEEIIWLRFLGREENVSISVEQGSSNIRIEGSRNVTAIATKVRLILRTMMENHSRFARMMSSEKYQWYYELQGESCRPFQPTNNGRIERAFQGRANKYHCVEDSTPLVVDFSTMTVTVQTSGDVGNVRREDLDVFSDIVIPSDWDPQPPDPKTGKPTMCHLVKVDPLSEEFVEVQDRFLRSLGGTRTIVLRIERVQNQLLWREYCVQKEKADNSNPARMTETEMWHGAAAEACQMISLYGFNSSITEHYDGGSQKGTTFAPDAAYAAKNLCIPDYCGRKKILIANVLVEERVSASRNAKPASLDMEEGNTQCDTSVDTSNPSLYVSLSGVEAYPVYLISFKVL